MDDLRAATGVAPPEEFAALADDDRAALAGLVSSATRERSQLVDRAIDDSLRYLPALLRGPVKRALGM